MTGQQMKTERINRGISCRGLARELNIPEQSLRRLERGDGVSLGYAKKIADYWGVTVLDILPDQVEEAA